MVPLDTDVALETPEHIVFRYRVAGPARRFFAYLLDLFFCYATVVFVGVIVALVGLGGGLVSGSTEALGAGVGLVLVLVFAAEWVYFAIFETFRGATLGKQALNLRVVTTSGRPIGFRQAALRNFLRAADAMPVFIAAGAFSVTGLVSCFLTKRFQRLGDLAAGTMVVVTERTRGAVPVRIWPPPTPEEMAALPRDFALDSELKVALELFLRRQERLGPARAHELASILASPLAERFRIRMDPTRLLALLYYRAVNSGRGEVPPSLRGG